MRAFPLLESHGSQARRRIGVGELRRQLRGVWYDERRADALRDEAPGAYKDIGRVMRAQSELTRIVRRRRPVLSYKGAGPWTATGGQP